MKTIFHDCSTALDIGAPAFIVTLSGRFIFYPERALDADDFDDPEYMPKCGVPVYVGDVVSPAWN